MIAQVIVNHNAGAVDKLYDYNVPVEMNVEVGSKVIVPFGRGNREREAYVFKLCENSRATNLKNILSAGDGMPVFDEKMLKLVYWMRERYLCSFIDILRTVTPAGTAANPDEWIIISDKNIPMRSKTQKKIVEILEDNGGACEINYFMQFFETNIKSQIAKMCEAGILKKEFREQSKVRDKLLRVASINIDEADLNDEIDNLYKSRAFAQAKILDILAGNEFIAVSDLVKFAGCSYNTVNMLEKKGLIVLKNITVLRQPEVLTEIKKSFPPILNKQQQYAAEKIGELVTAGKNETVLLHGVTGSGKTEVFMNSIKRVIENGRQAIVLVPEISLTPQTMNRFISRFGERVAVLHSGLSLGERYDQWKRIKMGMADIIIGARSAVFAPCDNIGIIIMDEEHEQTYKSEMTPRYDTHEVAAFRAAQHNAPLVLASATPSVGSYYKAKKGEYMLLELTERANEKAEMPEVSVVDMRKELEDGNKSIFSRQLAEEIEKNLQNKQQTILFLNRRGFSTFVSCRSCGFVARCPSCSISLTYHKFSDKLKCHYCGYTHENYEVCPSCGSKYIRYFGGGTQKVEEEIHKLFPNATTIRMDVDTTGRKYAHEKILNEFEKKKIDILIGTQMVAKGLDFENITLVGVISADVMLNLDDYRAAEKSFSVLEQVTGRAGRAQKPGRAIIQTYSPDNDSIICTKKHDYKRFFDSEILMRKALLYPPFCEMILIMFTSVNEMAAAQAANFYTKQLQISLDRDANVKILGPIPSAVSKIKNKYRRQIVLKCDNSDALNTVLEDARQKCLMNPAYKRVSVIIDKNPNGIV